MPTYRLTYFNVRGRAEALRQMLVLAGQEYEDRRVQMGEEWEKLKPETPFGQLPLLEVDGKVICQSNAAARYIAKTFGFYGTSDWEAAQIDMIVDCMEDTIHHMFAFFFSHDSDEAEIKNVELKKKFEDEQLPTALRNLEKIIAANGTGQYFVGNKLSWADFHVMNFLSFPPLAGVKINYADYPKIQALIETITNEPTIKQWIETRPVTPM